MFTKLIILLIIASKNSEITCSLYPEEEISIAAAQCLTEIAKRYFPPHLPVTIQLPIMKNCNDEETYYSHNENDLLVNFIKHSEFQQIILACYGSEWKTRYYLNKPGGAIIVLPDPDLNYMKIHLRLSLRKVHYFLGNLGVPAVIVSSSVFTSRKEKTSAILELLNLAWQNTSTADIIVLVPEVRKSLRSSNKNLSIEIYSWLPETQRDTCLREINEVSLLDTWISPKRKFIKNSNLFPDKNTIGRKCTLSVGLYQAPPHVFINRIMSPGWNVKGGAFSGLYKHVLQVLSEQYSYNFSLHNAHIQKDKYDITVPEYLKTDPYSCTVTYPRFSSAISWYVPIFPIPRWQGLIRVFGSTHWLLVAIAYTLGSLTFITIIKFQSKKRLDVALIFINTLQTHLAIGIPYKYKGIVSTAFMTLWLMYCIQICTYFQSELIGFLANPGYFPKINDLTELDNSGFQRMSNIIFDEEDHLNYPHCELRECLEELAKQRKLAVLGNNFNFETYIKHKFSINGKSQITRVIDTLRTFHFSATTTRGCKFVETLNSIMERSVEVGLTKKWLEDFKRIQWENVFRRNPTPETYVRPLNVASLQTHFQILITGLSFSFVVFIMEFPFKSIRLF